MKKLIALLFVLVLLLGCTNKARLYPANDLAAQIGLLEAEYVDSEMGGGEITVVMPDGEILKGEYTIADTASVGFGYIYTSVFGSGGSAYGTDSATSMAASGSSPGIATLLGDKGTMMQCEYFVSNLREKDCGACKSSNGALYRLHF